MRLLAISGSLRAASTNNALLAAALKIAAAGADVTTATAPIDQLPLFNPDLDTERSEPPTAVAALRAAVATADAVLVVSPEYAHGVPGALKNALDWLVSSAEFVGKPVAVITASPLQTGAEYAHAQLRETLRMMTAEVVPAACLAVPQIAPKLDRTTGALVDPALEADLVRATSALLAAAHR
jgi:chromate reductase, NAD(P)H dehydrogenase (quinone)